MTDKNAQAEQDEKMQKIKDAICRMDGAVCNFLIVCNQMIKTLKETAEEFKEANNKQQDIWRDDKFNR